MVHKRQKRALIATFTRGKRKPIRARTLLVTRAKRSKIRAFARKRGITGISFRRITKRRAIRIAKPAVRRLQRRGLRPIATSRKGLGRAIFLGRVKKRKR